MKQLLLLSVAVLGLVGAGCSPKEKIFRVELIKYLDNSYTRSFETSLQKGLEASGLLEGRDYVMRARSAQGDMSTLTMLVDAAVNAKADLLITFQAPTLYAAIQRAPDVDKMFTLLQNPFLFGAGRSDDDHLPHLTGLYMVPPIDELLTWVEQCRPAIETIGTIYDPGNEDSVFRKDELTRYAAARRMKVLAVPYTSQNEIMLATENLMSMSPGAIVHLQDPAQDVTFPALFKSAQRRKIPVFSLVFNMEKIGAVIACSTDRDQIGAKFAKMVERVIRGEDPTFMPFENDRALNKRHGYNRTVATDINLTLPEGLLK
jgi:putative tryptophan/tyrosine transport system substrate-binding protein